MVEHCNATRRPSTSLDGQKCGWFSWEQIYQHLEPNQVSGYWQVPLDKDAQVKSAFATGSRLWKWKVLPLGLMSALAKLSKTALEGFALILI